MGRRSVMVEINGEEEEVIEYVSGLPQGSPVSPILFNTLMLDLGKRVEKVAAEAITNHMERKGSLHQGQYGG